MLHSSSFTSLQKAKKPQNYASQSRDMAIFAFKKQEKCFCFGQTDENGSDHACLLHFLRNSTLVPWKFMFVKKTTTTRSPHRPHWKLKSRNKCEIYDHLVASRVKEETIPSVMRHGTFLNTKATGLTWVWHLPVYLHSMLYR